MEPNSNLAVLVGRTSSTGGKLCRSSAATGGDSANGATSFILAGLRDVYIRASRGAWHGIIALLLCGSLSLPLLAFDGTYPPYPTDNGAAGDESYVQPGYTRLNVPYNLQPPGSVFVQRGTTSSGIPIIASRTFVTPSVPVADPTNSTVAPYPNSPVLPYPAGGNSNSEPLLSQLNITGLDLFSFMPHASYLVYGPGSVKETGVQAGAYGLISNTINTLELGFDETQIKFHSGFNLAQQDVTVILSDYAIPNFRLRAGLHYIGNNDPTSTNSGFIAFGGVHYFETGRYDFGVDAYSSHYGSYAPPITITQITPHIGLQINQVTRGDLKGYCIYTDKDLGLNQTAFYSVEGRLGQDFGKVSYAGYGWGGQQTFAVRNDGFVIYNLNEKHTGGFGGEYGYKFNDRMKLTGRVSDELFSDFSLQKHTNLFFVTGLLAINF